METVEDLPPNRAPPLPLDALHVMAGYSLFSDRPLFAWSLLLGFHGLLREGELLGIQKAHVVKAGPRSPAVISLGLVMGGKRAGAVAQYPQGPTAFMWGSSFLEEDFQ